MPPISMPSLYCLLMRRALPKEAQRAALCKDKAAEDEQHGESDQEGRQRGKRRILVLVEVKIHFDWQRVHDGFDEKDRGFDFIERRDEGKETADDEAGAYLRQDDEDKRPDRPCAQITRRFFDDRIDLSEIGNEDGHDKGQHEERMPEHDAEHGAVKAGARGDIKDEKRKADRNTRDDQRSEQDAAQQALATKGDPYDRIGEWRSDEKHDQRRENAGDDGIDETALELRHGKRLVVPFQRETGWRPDIERAGIEGVDDDDQDRRRHEDQNGTKDEAQQDQRRSGISSTRLHHAFLPNVRRLNRSRISRTPTAAISRISACTAASDHSELPIFS